MLKPRDRDPGLPPGRILVGKAQYRVTNWSLGILAATCLVLAGLLSWTVSRPREVAVVVTDREGSFVEIATAASRWAPENGMWRNEAQRWLKNVRARSLDPGAWPEQITALVNTTDRSQWSKVDDWLKKTVPDTNQAIDVEITEATVLEATPQTGEVFLRWRERKRQKNGHTDDWSVGSATLVMAKGPPIIEGEADIMNPFGLYLFQFEFNPLREIDDAS